MMYLWMTYLDAIQGPYVAPGLAVAWLFLLQLMAGMHAQPAVFSE
jgi:hypothetical protein